MAKVTLKAISITGYKGFAENSKFSISPMTLVYGENSAGKSSLLRLVVSLAEAIREMSRHAMLPVGGKVGMGFREIIGGRSKIGIEFAFETESGSPITSTCVVQHFPESNAAKVVDFNLVENGQPIFALQLIDSPDAGFISTYTLIRPGKTASVELVEFNGVLPYLVDSMGTRLPEESSTLTTVRDAMSDLSKQLIWIGPLRHSPPRDIALTPCPERFSQDGSNIVQLLHSSNPLGKELVAFVSDWYERSTKHILTVDANVSNGHEVFTIFLAPKASPHLVVPISEHGAGMAQVLPIVIACGLAKVAKVPYFLVLENPELHLHDGVHEKLAELLAETAESTEGVRVVTETHSENILLTLQLKAILAADRRPLVSVNWVQKDEAGGSTCRSYEFDEGGSLGGLWSKSIFGYTGELARRVLEARMAKREA